MRRSDPPASSAERPSAGNFDHNREIASAGKGKAVLATSLAAKDDLFGGESRTQAERQAITLELIEEPISSSTSSLTSMVGFPVLSGGEPVTLEGATGIVYQRSPEEEAFNRWQNGEFLEVERGNAKRWRQELQSIDLKSMATSFKEIHEAAGKPQALADIKALAENIVDGPDHEAVLMMGLALTIGDGDWSGEIIARWESLGRPAVRQFAPYLAYVLTVDLFFYLGMAASQIGSDRNSNKVDIAYLYYLPFCMIFTSRDDLHVRAVPLFLRADQSLCMGTT
jgi:hypothetical protein